MEVSEQDRQRQRRLNPEPSKAKPPAFISIPHSSALDPSLELPDLAPLPQVQQLSPGLFLNQQVQAREETSRIWRMHFIPCCRPPRLFVAPPFLLSFVSACRGVVLGALSELAGETRRRRRSTEGRARRAKERLKWVCSLDKGDRKRDGMLRSLPWGDGGDEDEWMG